MARVADPHRVVAGGASRMRSTSSGCEDVRQVAPRPRRVEQGRHVPLDDPLAQREAVEAADGGHLAGQRRRAAAVAPQPAERSRGPDPGRRASDRRRPARTARGPADRRRSSAARGRARRAARAGTASIAARSGRAPGLSRRLARAAGAPPRSPAPRRRRPAPASIAASSVARSAPVSARAASVKVRPSHRPACRRGGAHRRMRQPAGGG